MRNRKHRYAFAIALLVGPLSTACELALDFDRSLLPPEFDAATAEAGKDASTSSDASTDRTGDSPSSTTDASDANTPVDAGADSNTDADAS